MEDSIVSNNSMLSVSALSESSTQSNLLVPAISSPSLLIPSKQFKCNNNNNRYCIFMITFVLLIIGLMWLSTSLLPSGYDKFFLPVDNRGSGYWIITEPSPSAWTINLRIGNGYLHIYIDVLIYYFGIFLTLFISFICRQFTKSRKILTRYIFLKQIKICGGISFMLSLRIGQLIMFLIWFIIISMIFIYFQYYHTFGSWPFLDPLVTEKFIRTCGILSSIFCGLLLIPVCRGNQILSYCFGITFESAIKYHKILGVLMILFAIIHCIGFIILLIKNNSFSPGFNIFFLSQMPSNNDWHGDNWTILLMQIIILFPFIPFIITAIIPIIRRKYWEIFYFIHIYGSLVIVIGLMYHADQAWYFMFPGLILQFYERLWRLWNNSKNNINILSLKQVSTNITRLEININNQHPFTKLGSYYFINIPHLSLFQWHPFSVCNNLNSPYTQFYIKNIGNYTSKLLNFANTFTNNDQQRVSLKKLDIQIEGPFGCDIDYHSYHKLVLIAGGIGITPIHNLFFTLYDQSLLLKNDDYKLPSIDLIWIVRYANIFKIFKKSFNKYISSDVPNMNIYLYATRETKKVKKDSSIMHGIDINNDKCDDDKCDHDQCDHDKYDDDIDCPIKWKIGRPDLFQELRYLDELGNKAMVYCCGPTGLVQTCQQLAYLYNNHFKKETFLF